MAHCDNHWNALNGILRELGNPAMGPNERDDALDRAREHFAAYNQCMGQRGLRRALNARQMELLFPMADGDLANIPAELAPGAGQPAGRRRRNKKTKRRAGSRKTRRHARKTSKKYHK